MKGIELILTKFWIPPMKNSSLYLPIEISDYPSEKSATCWTKPRNSDANLQSLDTRGNDGTMRLIAPISLHYLIPWWQASFAHGSDRSYSHITNHSTSYSVCYTSFKVFRIIQHRLQQSGKSARHPLLHLSLTGNHRHSRHQWCEERWTRDGTTLCLKTIPVSA